MGAAVDFGELTSLLARAAPGELAELRASHPEHERELRAGAVMGDSSAILGAQVALRALEQMMPEAMRLRDKLRARLRLGQRLDLISKLTATIGSGSAAGFIATHLGDATQSLIAAGVGLVGSLSGLVLGYVQSVQGAGAVTDLYGQLVQALVNGESVRMSLPVLIAGGDTPELRSAVEAANAAAREVNKLILGFG